MLALSEAVISACRVQGPPALLRTKTHAPPVFSHGVSYHGVPITAVLPSMVPE
jgi:hypothetical protein